MVHIAVGGQQNEVDVAATLSVANLATQLVTLNTGHIPVGDNHRVPASAHEVETFATVPSDIDIVSEMNQAIGEEFRGYLVIFDDEYFEARCHGALFKPVNGTIWSPTKVGHREAAVPERWRCIRFMTLECLDC